VDPVHDSAFMPRIAPGSIFVGLKFP
jgi:hypothetical protein